MKHESVMTHLSVEDYLRGEESAERRHEYVDGFVYAMGGASERHNRVSVNLAFHLRAAARGTPCGVYAADMKVRVASVNAFYYPDVVLACAADDDHPYYKERPCLIAEVLSPSTANIDRREKWLHYRQIDSLHYYLIVDPDTVAVEYYCRNAEGEWLGGRLAPDEMLDIDCGPVATVLSLDDIYEDTGLVIPFV